MVGNSAGPSVTLSSLFDGIDPQQTFCLLVTAALDELSSLPPDLIQRGPELGPSFVNFMELPPRFARFGAK